MTTVKPRGSPTEHILNVISNSQFYKTPLASSSSTSTSSSSTVEHVKTLVNVFVNIVSMGDINPTQSSFRLTARLYMMWTPATMDGIDADWRRLAVANGEFIPVSFSTVFVDISTKVVIRQT